MSQSCCCCCCLHFLYQLVDICLFDVNNDARCSSNQQKEKIKTKTKNSIETHIPQTKRTNRSQRFFSIGKRNIEKKNAQHKFNRVKVKAKRRRGNSNKWNEKSAKQPAPPLPFRTQLVHTEIYLSQLR